MANNNTYVWSFPALEVTKVQGNYTDVVYKAHWRIKGADPTTSHSAEVYGVQDLPAYNPASGSFIPYENITKELVTNWVLSEMGPRYGEITESIDARITDLIYPKTERLPPPW